MSRKVAASIIAVVMTFTLAPVGAAPDRAGRATVPLTMAKSVVLGAGEVARLGFVATHVAFSWRGRSDAIRYRTLDASGRPSPWRTAIEDHALRSGARRYSGVLSVGRISGVRWRLRRTDRGRVRSLAVHYMNTLDGPRRGVSAERGTASGARPAMISRDEWGADESIKKTRARCRRSFWPVQQLFVHHTAGSNFDSHPEATMRAIYYFHTVSRGWCDVGYNFVISPDGRIFEGRWARRFVPGEVHDSEDATGKAVRGAHVESFNSGSVGISLMGNYSTAPVSRAMRSSLVRMLAWESGRHDLAPLARHTYRNPETGLRRWLPVIAGHRHAGQTACPGGNVLRALPAIRRQVARAVANGGAHSRTTLSASRRIVGFGGSAELTGRVVRRSGASLAGREVTLLKRLGGRWRLHERVTTDSGGGFSSTIVPWRSLRVAAEFEGGEAAWGSSSRAVRLGVAARVSLQAPEGEADGDGVLHFPQGTEEIVFTGSVTPAKPDGRVRVRMLWRRDDGSYVRTRSARRPLGPSSTYRYTFLPRVSSEERSFKAVASFAGDRKHLGGSRRLYFVIESG